MNTYKKIKEICDDLQRKSEIKMNNEIESAKKYHEGYVQGCENLLKRFRWEMRSEEK